MPLKLLIILMVIRIYVLFKYNKMSIRLAPNISSLRRVNTSLDSFNRSGSEAFSLIELLVVIAMMTILTMLASVSISSLNRSSGLTSAGNKLFDLAALARQNAMSHNSITALVLVTNIEDLSLCNRVLGVMEMNSSGQWVQVRSWTFLNAAIAVSDGGSSGNDYLMDTNGGEVSLSAIRGQVPSSYSAVIFYPDGRMKGVPGQIRTLSVTYSASANQGSAQNYYNILLNPDTSAIHIMRP
jgi:Tfp pilus assembly protein FimT